MSQERALMSRGWAQSDHTGVKGSSLLIRHGVGRAALLKDLLSQACPHPCPRHHCPGCLYWPPSSTLCFCCFCPPSSRRNESFIIQFDDILLLKPTLHWLPLPLTPEHDKALPSPLLWIPLQPPQLFLLLFCELASWFSNIPRKFLPQDLAFLWSCLNICMAHSPFFQVSMIMVHPQKYLPRLFSNRHERPSCWSMAVTSGGR
jgi:hypothetical protein